MAHEWVRPHRCVSSSHPVSIQTALHRLPGWFPAIADQGVIAITNLAMSIVITRVGGVGDLGTYSLISMTMLACLGFERVLVTDPWLSSRLTYFPVRAHPQDQLDAAVFGPQIRMLVLLSAVFVTIPTLLVAWVAGGGWTPWLVTGLTAALMTLQDGGRYAAYKRRETWRALASDAALLLTTTVGLLLGLALGRLDLSWVLYTYTAGFVVACAPSIGALIGPVTFRQTGLWWTTVCRRLGMPLLQDSIAYFISTNISAYLLAALASKEAVGSVRVVTTLYSPLAMVFTGMSMWLVPSLTTRGLEQTRAMRGKAMLGLSATGLLVTAIAVTIGPWLAPIVFGSDAQIGWQALLIGGLSTWLNAIASIWIATVKVFGQYRPISWARTVSGLALIGLMLLVAAAHSVNGYLLLLFLQNATVASTAWWLQRSHTAHERESHV